MLGLDARQFMALLVQDVDCHIVGDLDRDRGGAVLLGFFLDAAQDAQRGGFHRTHDALAVAMRAGDG